MNSGRKHRTPEGERVVTRKNKENGDVVDVRT